MENWLIRIKGSNLERGRKESAPKAVSVNKSRSTRRRKTLPYLKRELFTKLKVNEYDVQLS